MNVGSLFSGIGGIELGLERAGMETLWQVEINPFCLEVLEKHWPNVERFRDVADVGAANLRAVDLICGGFPCQDISQAGRGEGISGSRSGLWSEFARIIGELRPKYVLVENVPLIKARGLEVVLSDLAALGYDAEWDCIPAAAVGAPHRRDRFFLVAYPDSQSAPERGERTLAPQSGAGGTHDRDRGNGLAKEISVLSAGEGEDVSHSYSERLQRLWPEHELREGKGEESAGWGGWWRTEPDVGRVAYGVPARVDRLTALGNAVVPQVAQWIGERIMAYEGR